METKLIEVEGKNKTCQTELERLLENSTVDVDALKKELNDLRAKVAGLEAEVKSKQSKIRNMQNIIQ